MSKPFSGKVAIVTGGSKGIGASIASQLVAKGASVVVTYGSDAASADNVVTKLGKENVLAVKSDASKTSDSDALIKQTVDRFGKIDFLMLNAAYVPMKSLEETTEETFDTTMATNIKGPYFLAQVTLHLLQAGTSTSYLHSCVEPSNLSQPLSYSSFITCFIDLSLESPPTYVSWRACCTIFHVACHCLKYCAALPPLYDLQGSDRADDSCPG